MGKKVLVIDLNAQGNLTEYLGDDYSDDDITITDLMLSVVNNPKLKIEGVLLTMFDNINMFNAYFPAPTRHTRKNNKDSWLL